MADGIGIELAPGEEVLWRGRPRAGFRWGLPQIASLIVGVPTSLSGLWMLAGALTPEPDLFLMLPALVASGSEAPPCWPGSGTNRGAGPAPATCSPTAGAW